MFSELEAGRRSAVRKPARSYLTRVMTPRQLWKYRLLVALWAALSALFWIWWLQPSHVIAGWSFALATLAIFWLYFVQVYFLGMMLNARRAASRLEDLGAIRVATVVTKAPSEPFAVVRETLEALLAQDVPHDTWLADEDPAPETIAWCAAHGVQISTRRGRADYHRATWPRRTRCKEGNLAFFYDTYGYDRYDFVAQFDADHAPEPTYLRNALPAFADPSVGYVSAPSICDKNASASWAARMRLYAEAAFHGVLQAGYSGGWAPMCIGSHYTVRTSALREIGGLGPELAEDHSTSMLFNSGGWRGVHAMDSIAHGDGPARFADMVTQEFQWSRSLVTLLLQYTPRYLGTMPAHLRFQFVFCQLWYPLFALFMALMYVMPIVALTFNMRFADVTYPGFLIHAVPPALVMLAIIYQIRRDGLFRPSRARILSWEHMLFPLAQWIWVLWGCSVAVWDRLTGRFVDFRITPKGATDRAPLPMRVVAPYAVLAAGAILTPLMVDHVTDARGFYLLCLINGAFYGTLLLVIVLRHWRETARGAVRPPLAEWLQLAVSLALLVCFAIAIHIRGVESVAALTLGLEPFHVTEQKVLVSGAGKPPGSVRYVIDFYWD